MQQTNTPENLKTFQATVQKLWTFKVLPYIFIQISITSCSKFQISIVISFQKAKIETHTPSKSQSKLRTTAKVIACQTSASQWMASGFHRKTNLHNFCYITPNSIFETSIESSKDKEQTLKFLIPYKQNSLSYIKLKSYSKPSHPIHQLSSGSPFLTPWFLLPHLGFN